jgi:hypothetical protein
MTARQFFARAMKTVRILWGALLFSNVLLGVVTVLAPSQARHPPELTSVEMLAAAALAVAVASFVVPARMRATYLAASRAETTPAEPTPTGAGPARFAHPDQAARRAMGGALTPFILSMALSEAVSIVGLQLHMLGAAMTVSTPFIVAGTVLAAVRFPTLARLVGPFERAHAASFAASEGG